MPIIDTPYTPDELAKVPAGTYEFVDVATALEAIEHGMRAYGLASIPNGGDQIVKINGQRDIDRFQLHALWLSHNSIRDFIRPARH